MVFSEKLNGYWEEGYHYFLEFRDDKMTLRRYDRVIELETTVTYDAATLDRGERTVITPANDRISSGLTGNMMREIHELRYVNGVLELETHDYADEYKIQSTGSHSHSNHLALNFTGRASVTYNWDRFFVSANGQFNNFNYKHYAMHGHLNDWYINAAVGVRF